MTEHHPLDDLKHESSVRGKDPKTRKLLIFLVALWLITLAALVGVSFSAYFKEKEKSQTLAQQITIACQGGNLGPDVSPEDTARICGTAEKIIENDGEIQDDEVQEREIQEPEIQESEIQDPEDQDRETQDIETQDAETQDAEDQESEIQEPEIQDDETQDPEKDDPDPNDQITGVSCDYTGPGTLTITVQTVNGPVTTTCGSGSPAQTERR